MEGFWSAQAKARDAWFESDEGKKCSEGMAWGQYLRNRLELAFLAGYDAAVAELSAEREAHAETRKRDEARLTCKIAYAYLTTSQAERTSGKGPHYDQVTSSLRRHLPITAPAPPAREGGG